MASALALAATIAEGGANAQVRVEPTPPPPVVAVVADAPRAPIAPIAPVATAAPTEAVPRPRRHHAKGDPLEGFNRVMFAIHQFFDRVLIRPVAFGYKTIIPKPLRRGISNLFQNLEEPVVFVNDILQLRPKRAAETLARFIMNSSAGVGGIFDVAKSVDLPHRVNGFANTLARYGVKPGPYLFIPLFGPGSFRDSPGSQIDVLVLQLGVGFPFRALAYTVPSTVLPGLDLRIESDADLKAILGGAADPYASLRSAYLQNREAEVAELTGKPATSALDDPLLDPEAPAAGTAPPAAEMPDANEQAAPDAAAPAIDPVTTPAPVVTPAPQEVPPPPPGSPQFAGIDAV